ncbi:MAG: DUF4175 family protein [Paracoccaceae bacterium]|nr:DUF4175 family protein [Paracoccaceae bacterium]
MDSRCESSPIRVVQQRRERLKRAQDLLEEIRRRSGDQSRPQNERDYLRRLLDLFKSNFRKS